MYCKVLLSILLPAAILDQSISLPMDTGDRQGGGLSWSWNTNDYPNPQTNYAACKQTKPSFICDPDNLLTQNDAIQLNELIRKLQNSSPCLCKTECAEEAHKKGLVIGALLMGSFYHPYSEDIHKAASTFANNIMKDWKLGTCGNEIIIMISRDQRVANIQTGHAVKDFILDETVQDIFNSCKGHLDSGHYYQGLESIINSLYDTVQGKILKSPGVGQDEENMHSANVGLIVGLVVGFICLAGLFAVGLIFVQRRRRQNANQDKFMYDGSGGRPGSGKRDPTGPIVKTPVVFPDAIYQPCSIEDTGNSLRIAGSDEEDEGENHDEFCLENLEENPAYEPSDTIQSTGALSATNEASKFGTSEPPVRVHGQNIINQMPQSDDRHVVT